MKARLAAVAGGYEIVHASPGPAGAKHRFIGYEQLSVLVSFERRPGSG